MICWKCHKEINSIEQNEVYRTSECPFCHSMLHCCKGCKFYSPGNHFDCKECVTDFIPNKENSNFCDYFSTGSFEKSNGNAFDNKADIAKAAFNALFGGSICL